MLSERRRRPPDRTSARSRAVAGLCARTIYDRAPIELGDEMIMYLFVKKLHLHAEKLSPSARTSPFLARLRLPSAANDFDNPGQLFSFIRK